jgi:hypothetical protein
MIVLQGGVVNPTPNPQLFWRTSVFCRGCLPLAGWSQFESVRNSLFALAWLSRKNVAQESRRRRACIGLGTKRWHYPSFDSTHPPARCVPPGATYCPFDPPKYALFISWVFWRKNQESPKLWYSISRPIFEPITSQTEFKSITCKPFVR